MNEQQLEALEKLAKKHFPNGLMIGTIAPNGELHMQVVEADEHFDLYQYLCELICWRIDEITGDEEDGDALSAAG